MRRLIAPWEYRHLRLWASVRNGAGNDWTTYAWTIALLAAGVGQFLWAYWELTIARAEFPRTT
jgi:hypothetical protein